MIREPKREGGLTPEAFRKLIDVDYDPAARRVLAAAVQSTESDLDMITERFFGEEFAKKYDSLTGIARHAMLYVVAQDGLVRGENLRRDMLLDGFGDTSPTLCNLINEGLFIVLPNPGELELDVPRLVETGTVLQRDLAIGLHIVETYKEISKVVLAEETADIDGVEQITSSSTDTLEMNLLHASTKLLHAPLKLNRDGAPHRRGLAKLAREIVFPGTFNEAGPEVDVNKIEILDYMVFLFAMGCQLGMLTNDGEQLEGASAGMDAYFASSISKRNRMLGDAFKGLRQWNEADSFAAEKVEDLGSSLTAARGETLIGARGYVFSILRRSRFTSWKLEDAVESLCALMDPPFLQKALDKAQTEVPVWVGAFLRRGLYWIGAVERGRTEEGPVIRFSKRGREMLGLNVKDTPAPVDKSMVIQPNFELMIFLDSTDVTLLHRIYRVTERVKLSDRVAVFKLTPESVQRGYSMGENAAAIIKFLRDNAAVEVPESVTFQLHDWERIHKRLVVHHSGYLVRHHDPDALDMWLGQVKHDTKCNVVRLGPSTAYLSENDEVLLEKLLTRARGSVINIEEPNGVLDFVGPLLATVDPLQADVITMWELSRIAHEVEDAPPRLRQFALDVALLKIRWPQDTLQKAVTFLEPRSKGGLPASQRILLQSMLEAPPTAAIHTHMTVIQLQDEFTADLFDDVEEFQEFVAQRLGPMAFSVDSSKIDDLREKMIELGFKL